MSGTVDDDEWDIPPETTGAPTQGQQVVSQGGVVGQAASTDPVAYQRQMGQLLASLQQPVQLPSLPSRSTPDDGTRPGWLGLLGEALSGGQSPLYHLRGQQEDLAGSRALLNFGINMMLASGPNVVRTPLASAFASGLQGAQQSMDQSQQAAYTQAGQQFDQQKALAQLGIQQQDARIKMLPMYLRLLQMQGMQNLPGYGTTPSAPGTTAPPSYGGQTLPQMPPEYEQYFQQASKQYNIPVDVLKAMAANESGFDPTKVGGAGEIGLMQVKPSTAAKPGFGVAGISNPETALRDPATNIMMGAAYLRGRAGNADLTNPAELAKALTAYNGGGDKNYAANVFRYMPGAPGGGTQPPAPYRVAGAVVPPPTATPAPGAALPLPPRPPPGGPPPVVAPGAPAAPAAPAALPPGQGQIWNPNNPVGVESTAPRLPPSPPPPAAQGAPPAAAAPPPAPMPPPQQPSLGPKPGGPFPVPGLKDLPEDVQAQLSLEPNAREQAELNDAITTHQRAVALANNAGDAAALAKADADFQAAKANTQREIQARNDKGAAAAQAIRDAEAKRQQSAQDPLNAARGKQLEQVQGEVSSLQDAMNNIQPLAALNYAAGQGGNILAAPGMEGLKNYLVANHYLSDDQISKLSAQDAYDTANARLVSALRAGTGITRTTQYELQYLQGLTPGKAFTAQQIRDAKLGYYTSMFAHELEFKQRVLGYMNNNMDYGSALDKANQDMANRPVIPTMPRMYTPPGSQTPVDLSAPENGEYRTAWRNSTVPPNGLYFNPYQPGGKTGLAHYGTEPNQ